MDGRTIYRCLLNLVSNAIDACIFDEHVKKKHFITVKTDRDKDNFFRFEVRDNGSGMKKEVRKQLFASFFSTKGSQGTGLGLLVTRKLIEENNGTIDVTSEWGQGTVFTIRLPIMPAHND